MSHNPPAEIAIGRADVGEENCHGDLRHQYAFLYRMTFYRLLNGRAQPCKTGSGSVYLDCPLPARG